MWVRNGVFFRSHSEIRRAFPNVSMPRTLSEEMLTEFGFVGVVSSPQPDVTATQIAVPDDAPTEVSPGAWTLGWTVREKTPTELREDLDAASREVVKSNPQVLALLRASPEQIATYIDTNVTNLAGAKHTLNILAQAVSVLAQSLLRETDSGGGDPGPDPLSS